VRLTALVDEFLDRERPTGNIATPDQVLACAIESTRLYSAFGTLTDATVTSSPDTITFATDVTESEWGVIMPLFRLYVERDAAKAVEASRGMGVETFGRTVSEVAADITLYEERLPHLAFEQEPFTVGIPGV
jgi:hypothetical protein